MPPEPSRLALLLRHTRAPLDMCNPMPSLRYHLKKAVAIRF